MNLKLQAWREPTYANLRNSTHPGYRTKSLILYFTLRPKDTHEKVTLFICPKDLEPAFEKTIEEVETDTGTISAALDLMLEREAEWDACGNETGHEISPSAFVALLNKEALSNG